MRFPLVTYRVVSPRSLTDNHFTTGLNKDDGSFGRMLFLGRNLEGQEFKLRELTVTVRINDMTKWRENSLVFTGQFLYSRPITIILLGFTTLS